ncbi:MAG: chemotaxis protein CheB, partial [Rickettsiales bacterium]|nr:chemotaxis protein CheB [Rickettsiales bacterium]
MKNIRLIASRSSEDTKPFLTRLFERIQTQPLPASEIFSVPAEPIQKPRTPPNWQSGKYRPSTTPKATIVVLAASTGGPDALRHILSRLPATIPAPVLIVQHMSTYFIEGFVGHLQCASTMPCHMAKQGERLLPSHIYVAPGDHHLLAASKPHNATIQLTQSPPEHFCRPAADPLLRSVAKLYGKHALAIILTGMGEDGLDGARHIREAGGTVIIQNKESSIVWGMPGAIAREKLYQHILPLTAIPEAILDYTLGT